MGTGKSDAKRQPASYARQRDKIAALEREIADLRKEIEAYCAKTKALCAENERLRNTATQLVNQVHRFRRSSAKTPATHQKASKVTSSGKTEPQA
jgi:predicted RNase H-like nuclease (RuvC/YqgF family)